MCQKGSEVNLSCNCVILSTNKGGQINFSVIKSCIKHHNPNPLCNGPINGQHFRYEKKMF
jgi:hypothetical protein